jgi:Polyketide cyclase / dehydrase and lipid transport
VQDVLMARRTTTIDRTTTLTSPPATVFAVVNSPETAPMIDPAVREWSADSRPIGVGRRFAIRGRLGPVPIRGTSEVVTWDPPTLAEYRSVAPTWPFRMTAQHRFDAHPDGGTDYTWSISFHEVNVIAHPLIALAARLFEDALAAQAEALAIYLRSRSADDPPPRL